MARPLSVMMFGCGTVLLVADVLDVINDVVGVLLQRVIDAGFEVGLRAVVVDAQPAADVENFKPRAVPSSFDVNARRLDHCAFDVADVGDLAAEVEMQQLAGNLPCPLP